MNTVQSAPSRPLANIIGDEHFRLLVNAVTDYAIYMLDPAGHVVSWNAGAQRFKGYAPHEIIGRHFSTFYTEEDKAAGIPALALRTAESTGKFEAEGWRLRKDGTRFWAHVVIDPIFSTSGELVGFAKITRDLSERRETEEKLRRTQEEFRLLVQGVTDYGIYMLDPNGRITTWNAGAERIKGYTPEEIVGQHFSRFYTEEDRAAGAPAEALAIAQREGRFEKEGWRVRKDGSRFWASVVVDPIRSADGTLLGFAKITRDITERRAAEQQLEKTRNALFQAQKMDAIGQLTGGIAHDFNNLLTVVLGSLELIQKRVGADARVSGLIANAVQATQRGATLTQRMLAFARQQDLKPVSVDVPALVDDMTDLMNRALGGSITVTTGFPPNLKPVTVDPNQLEMVLLNLAMNGRDAMPHGGPIAITAREEALADFNAVGLPAGSYVVLSVADRGAGMDAETLRRATEPFFTTKGVGKGTGLGLSMAHGLAEQSGGRLVLDSTPGEGTTASLWFPVDRQDGQPGAEAEPSLHRRPASDAPPPRSLSILAIDDDALILLNTIAMLEDGGHRVTAAYSGSEALAALRRGNRFDLVITDYAMPGMTGAQLIEAMKEEKFDIPIVLATGYAELPSNAIAGVPRISKPFLQDQLLQIAQKTAEP
jgi:PAS domain S-box-containing protein